MIAAASNDDDSNEVGLGDGEGDDGSSDGHSAPSTQQRGDEHFRRGLRRPSISTVPSAPIFSISHVPLFGSKRNEIFLRTNLMTPRRFSLRARIDGGGSREWCSVALQWLELVESAM